MSIFAKSTARIWTLFSSLCSSATYCFWLPVFFSCAPWLPVVRGIGGFRFGVLINLSTQIWHPHHYQRTLWVMRVLNFCENRRRPSAPKSGLACDHWRIKEGTRPFLWNSPPEWYPLWCYFWDNQRFPNNPNFVIKSHSEPINANFPMGAIRLCNSTKSPHLSCNWLQPPPVDLAGERVGRGVSDALLPLLKDLTPCRPKGSPFCAFLRYPFLADWP